MFGNSSESNSDESWRPIDPEYTALVLAEFNEKFPSEKHCIDAIVERLKADWCKLCGSRQIERGFGNRILSCRTCNKYSWVFAGTFFERMKLPRLYWGAIYLLERRLVFSANALSEWFGSAYASAFELLKKLRLVATSAMCALDEVSIRVFEKILLRRCLETAAGKHPSDFSEVEEDECDESAAANEECAMEEKDRSASCEMTSFEQTIAGLLSSTPVTFDDLVASTGFTASQINVALTMLEFAGIASRIPGDQYLRQSQGARSSARTAQSVQQSPIVSSISSFIKHYFGGISRRYLQLYIGGFWMTTSNRQSNEFNLFDGVANFGIVSPRFLEEIRSSLAVSIP